MSTNSFEHPSQETPTRSSSVVMASIIVEPNKNRSTLKDSFGYFGGQVLLMAVSFLTFPLFTRLLSKTDYGQLNLVSSTVLLLTLVASAGLPSAVVRFLPEYSSGNKNARSARFAAALLWGSVMSSAVVVVLILLVSIVLPHGNAFDTIFSEMRYVVPLLMARSVLDTLQQFFRMARNVGGYIFLVLSHRLLSVLCALGAWWFYRTFTSLLLGMASGETLAVLFGIFRSNRLGYWAWGRIAVHDLVKGLKFGYPLMLTGICATIMEYADRYFVQGYLGPSVVASYAVAYDLCAYIKGLFTASFRLSAMPAAMSRYAEEGPEAAAKFVADAFKYFSWLMVGLGFGLLAVGENLITLLASSKYVDAAGLLPYLVPAIMLAGLNFFFTFGLFSAKRNDIGFRISAVMVVVNLTADALLIPRWGARGAAIATLLTNGLLAVATTIASSRYMRVPFALGSLARTLGCGAAMFLVLTNFHYWPPAMLGFCSKVIGGAIFYVTLLALVEPEARQLLLRGKRSLWSIA